VVTFQQKPLSEAEVMFVLRQAARPATGRTDSQGRFELTTFRKGDGALLGEHAVIVVKLEQIPPGLASDAAGESASRNSTAGSTAWPKPKSLIPARYGAVQTSGLRATVTKGDNSFRFDLVP